MTRERIEKEIFNLSKDFRNLTDIMYHLYYVLFGTYPDKFYLQQYNKDEGVEIEKFEGKFDDSDDDCEDIDALNLDKKYFCKAVEDDPSIYTFLYEGDYYTCKFAVGDHFILSLPRMNDWANGWKYCSLYSEHKDYIEKLVPYIKLDNKQQDPSTKYYFVTGSQQGFKLHPMYLSKENITVSLEDNYNEDLPIKEINNFIENQLGIFIFNGIPGTGKSSLLKYLIANSDCKFIWMDSDLLVNIASDAFIDFIINQAKDSIIILEDCEKLLTDRKLAYNQNLGTLLNISDGILGDSLKLKFICTFNSDLRNIDSAVLRKGRLKGKYEFKKLSKDKTNNLCRKIGVPEMNCESTLADVYNQAPIDLGEQKKSRIGF